MPDRHHLMVVAFACTLLAACGTPGVPRPPSLELPRPVNDLAAARQGDRVTLTWTVPRETTDKQNIRHPGPVRICRGVNTTAMVQCPQVAELTPATAPPSKNSKGEQRSYSDSLPAQLQQQNPTGFATYAVESLNARGRSAGLSNQVEVPLAPTLPPPAQVTARVTSDNIEVRTSGTADWPHVAGIDLGEDNFHLFRRTGNNTADTDLGRASMYERMGRAYVLVFLDRTFEWEKTYSYHIAAITTVSLPGRPTVQVIGEPSAEVEVLAHDVFPPAAPSGLQAVAGGVGQPPFVDLTWAPNTEADLAGYNVYRHEADQPPVKINAELVKTPAYRDRAAASGHKYFYSVTAVDLRNNESPPSAEASETLP